MPARAADAANPSMPWPHAPTHQLSEAGTYFITAATYSHAQFFAGAKRLAVLHRGLLKVIAARGWRLEAWAVFSNHYHFIAHSPPSAPARSLTAAIMELHSRTAIWVNALDHTPGRRVWHNFWDTRLTYQRSYLARLNYVHQNPVRHGLVPVANQYPQAGNETFSAASARRVFNLRQAAVSVVGQHSGPLFDFTNNGGFLYIASGESGLRILDVSDPAAPMLVGQYPAGTDRRRINAVKVSVVGNVAYLANNGDYTDEGFTGSFDIVDVSNPGKPTLLGSATTDAPPQGLGIAGHFA